MSSDVEEPKDVVAGGGGYAHDSGWDLPELAPVFIIVSVGLLVVGSGISTGMSLVGQTGLSAGVGWSLVSSALRWIDPSTSTMLLLSAALIWWQYGYWSSDKRVDLSAAVIDAHIARLRSIAKWNLAAFLVTIASLIVLILASVLQNTYSHSPAPVWGYAVATICMALGTIFLALLGVVGLRRILTAGQHVDDWDPV